MSVASAEALLAVAIAQVQQADEKRQDLAAVVLADEIAIRVLAAFRSVDHRWTAPRTKEPPPSASLNARWQWVVSGWQIDVDGLAAATNLDPDTVDRKVTMLVCNRLVYPDGTLSNAAQLVLQAYISKQVGVRPGRPKKKEKEDG